MGVFSCEERCIPAHMQGRGYQLEEDFGKKGQRWMVTRDSAWRCEHDGCNGRVQLSCRYFTPPPNGGKMLPSQHMLDKARHGFLLQSIGGSLRLSTVTGCFGHVCTPGAT